MPYEFKFCVNNQVYFKTMLESFQCVATIPNGNRCKRICVLGENLCWAHLLSLKHLRILKSTVANAGSGLFAMDKSKEKGEIVFKKGDMICEYLGEKIDKEELIRRYGEYTAPYGVQLKNGVYIDAAGERGYCSLCNQARTFSQASAHLVANWTSKPQKVQLKAVKNIKNGDEILTWYGKDYDMNETHSTKYVKT